MSIRIELERRPSDFERDGRVTAFTGSCCCSCCCLHWIGAGAGAVIGMQRGWKTANETRGVPLDPASRSTIKRGMVASMAASLVALAVAIAVGAESWAGGPLIVLAFVPSLAVIPVGITMVLSAFARRQQMLAEFRRDAKQLPQKDGSDSNLSVYRMKLSAPPKTKGALRQFSVFCRECWADLDESMHLPACPECSKPIVAPVISGPDFGMGVAVRASGMSLLLATAGTVAGYAIMWLLSLL